MNFLFQTTIRQKGVELDYKVYEFKLHPGKFRAELITPADSHFTKEVTFWKEKSGWKVQPPSEAARRLAERFAWDIDRRKN
jgi:hypothetical protein